MHVTGYTSTPNYPLDAGSSVVVPFVLPEGGDAANIDLATATVSLNSNVLDPATVTVTLTEDDPPAFNVENAGTDLWPSASNISVQCDYKQAPNAGMGMAEIIATLEDHEARIAALETPVE